MAANRVYRLTIGTDADPPVGIDPNASTNNYPFAQIATPATMAVEIISFYLGQVTDVTAVQERISITRRSTATTLASAATLSPVNQRDPATGLTLSTTTCAYGCSGAGGTLVTVLRQLVFKRVDGCFWLPTPEERITIQPSSFLTFQFPIKPTTSMQWHGEILLRELI